MGVRFRLGLALCASLLVVVPAYAEPSSQDRATAQSFFDRAVSLMKDTKFNEACPLLEESQRLDPGVGTRFQLAKCYEGQGKVATAWIQYVDVADSAKAANQADRERIARQHASAVLSRVPKLIIEMAPGNASITVEVKRDGSVVPKGQWAFPVPVDPGKHQVTATAPGRKTWEGSIDVKESQETKVLVPELTVDTGAPPVLAGTTPPPASTTPGSKPPPATDNVAPSSGGSGQKLAGYVVGGVGVVALGAGVVLGFSAKSKANGAGADCQGAQCNSTGYDAVSSARKTGTVGTIVGVVGLAAIAGGVVLVLTSPSESPTIGLRLTPSVGGLQLAGGF